MNEVTTISRAQLEYSDAVKKALARKPQLYINGEWVDSSGGPRTPGRALGAPDRNCYTSQQLSVSRPLQYAKVRSKNRSGKEPPP